MKATHRFIISNVSIPVDEFEVTKFIKLQKVNDKTRLICETDEDPKTLDPYEVNILLAYRSLQLFLSGIQIRLERDKGYEDDFTYEFLKPSGGPLINFYASSGQDVLTAECHKSLSEDELFEFKRIHDDIMLPFSKQQNETRNDNKWVANRWNYAYQQYLLACRSITVDESVLKIITGLEALLVRGEGLLKYKVSLFASLILEESPEDRKEIYDFVGKMYNLRSKVVHGEIQTVNKLLNKPDVFEKNFALKNILSRLLLTTYSWEEEKLFERIDEIVFQAPKF